MATRHDVSQVPLQGGYIAKWCPVRAQNDVLRPIEPPPPSPILERRFERGRAFEDDVVATLLDLHPRTVVVDGEDSAAREAATTEAMRDGAPLILNSRLPSDPDGRRVGKPDLLVAAEAGGYRPADIKHHMTLQAASERSSPGLCAELAGLTLEGAEPDPAWAVRKHKGDLLQLAHYQRMLEAAGLAAADGRHGGIVGTEERVVWFDLDAPIWRTPSSSDRQKLRSTMEVYDFEFSFRLDIMAVATQHMADPATELLVVPVRIGECGACPWWDHCRPQLEVGSGDVSLIPRIGWREWKTHQDHGVRNRAELASLDPATADLIAAGIDVASAIAEANEAEPDTPLAELPGLGRRPAQVERMVAGGITVAGQVTALDERTASYSGSGLTALPEHIDRARAALGSEPVYRRRGVDELVVPRGDVEVDVDMENVEEGVYLWGALLTDRSAGDGTPEYHPFVTWDRMTPEVEAETFLRFWTWLMEVRDGAHREGRTFRAYCYSASAENTQLRALGLATGTLDQVEAFIASDEWVDMLRVFDDQLITGGGSGLKVIAPLAGFAWQVDDPGGEESMLRYEIALGAPSEEEREAARDWLLTYNRGDVEATLAIRDWLEKTADRAQPVRA